MKKPMSWEECKDHIRLVEKDSEKANSIMAMARIRHKTLRQIILDDETASVIATDYYEVIKELLCAILLKYGLKSDNHECLIAFFKKQYQQYEYEHKSSLN